MSGFALFSGSPATTELARSLGSGADWRVFPKRTLGLFLHEAEGMLEEWPNSALLLSENGKQTANRIFTP
jgi:hypothetical protein